LSIASGHEGEQVDDSVVLTGIGPVFTFDDFAVHKMAVMPALPFRWGEHILSTETRQ
jgi:hypothetical protein